MKALLLIVVTYGYFSGLLMADPAEFLRDAKEFRHGTHDRIWKLQTAYIDSDGSIYLPFGERLQKTDEKTFSSLIKKLEDGKTIKAYQIYVHPEAQWKNLQKSISAFTSRSLKIEWRIAELKPKPKAEE
nr:putative integron gene cassette protein [uncultured bacterium]